MINEHISQAWDKDLFEAILGSRTMIIGITIYKPSVCGTGYYL